MHGSDDSYQILNFVYSFQGFTTFHVTREDGTYQSECRRLRITWVYDNYDKVYQNPREEHVEKYPFYNIINSILYEIDTALRFIGITILYEFTYV